ncbi:hypothetical protein Q3G72_033323 [Acer saccharum]|nr:hypothetical protein Q3G72_033323 [Acer saccharum]
MEALHNSFNNIISHVRVNPSAVNNRNISAANAYNYGYPELKREIMALSEDIEDGPYVRETTRKSYLTTETSLNNLSRRPTMDSAASSSSNVEDISIGSTSHQSNVTIHETLDIIGPEDHHHQLLDAAAYVLSQLNGEKLMKP